MSILKSFSESVRKESGLKQKLSCDYITGPYVQNFMEKVISITSGDSAIYNNYSLIKERKHKIPKFKETFKSLYKS